MNYRRLYKPLLCTILATSVLTGCSIPQKQEKITEATTEGQISKFSVPDSDVASSETDNPDTLASSGLTETLNIGTNLLKEKDCGLLEMYSDNVTYLFYFENPDLPKTLFETTTGKNLSCEVTFDKMLVNDENTPFYDRICSLLEKNGVGMYGRVSKNILTLEGTKATDTYNFILCKASAIRIKDSSGNTVVENGLDIQSVKDALTDPAEKNKDEQNESQEADMQEETPEDESLPEAETETQEE